MAKEELEIGAISKPRFEFRSFGQDFDVAAYLMSRLSVPVPENSNSTPKTLKTFLTKSLTDVVMPVEKTQSSG